MLTKFYQFTKKFWRFLCEYDLETNAKNFSIIVVFCEEKEIYKKFARTFHISIMMYISKTRSFFRGELLSTAEKKYVEGRFMEIICAYFFPTLEQILQNSLRRLQDSFVRGFFGCQMISI